MQYFNELRLPTSMTHVGVRFRNAPQVEARDIHLPCLPPLGICEKPSFLFIPREEVVWGDIRIKKRAGLKNGFSESFRGRCVWQVFVRRCKSLRLLNCGYCVVRCLFGTAGDSPKYSMKQVNIPSNNVITLIWSVLALGSL